ncbi:MAG: PASTA domain-containing protein [Firmicutes bacterium]|nr:PASTA domain-containing protein [Bacillota bacterium]
MSKRKNVSSMTSRKRLVVFFSLVLAMFILIVIRIGWIQIVKADEYSNMALEQQTKDVPITAKRGNIYDTNMKALAINQSMYTIWIRPSEVSGVEKEHKGFTEQMAAFLTTVFPDKTQEEIYETITKKTSLVKLEKYATEEQTNMIRQELSNKNSKLAGVQIAEAVKRYYPMGAFAAHVIGSTNDDNNGLSGIELYYDQYLNGTEGRWIRSTDASNRNLSNGIEKYYPAEDGMGIVLTIDEVIQHYTEKAVEQVYADTASDRVMAITMDPKTGYILSMAVYPDFDLNDPRTPLFEAEQEKVAGMSDSEKVEYWNDMWRNPLVNDVYEPGSPFKLLTTAMALEEGVTSVDDTFVCRGVLNVAGQPLKCWRYYNPHGTETLAKGVANSCNPVFVTLSQRLGINKFYEYLDSYGFMGTSEIDYPGEAKSILQPKNSAGPVGLATMSYGQGIACTPIQMITALSTAGSGGKLMQPKLVKAFVDSNGNTVEEFEPTVKRQVVSEQTAKEICQMMEGVVTDGSGSAAYLPGYRVGGKTGTADKVENGKYAGFTYSSFFAMAPMDDPQIAVIVIADSPKGVHFGSQTAGPGVRSILYDTLRYMKVEPVYTDKEQIQVKKDMATVPDLVGKTFAQAQAQLSEAGLLAIACPAGETEFEVIDQYPKSGEKISKGNAVCLYKE